MHQAASNKSSHLRACHACGARVPNLSDLRKSSHLRACHACGAGGNLVRFIARPCLASRRAFGSSAKHSTAKLHSRRMAPALRRRMRAAGWHPRSSPLSSSRSGKSGRPKSKPGWTTLAT
eukprot:1157151-Pelagomonas_calceolata.AAC.1